LIILLSFAGIPPFAGFFIKFFILLSVLNNNLLFVVIFLIVAILVGTFLYLRFLKIALFEKWSLSKLVKVNRDDFYALIKLSKEANLMTTTTKHDNTTTGEQAKTKIHWEHRLTSILLAAIFFLLLFLIFLPIISTKLFDVSLLLLLCY